MRPRSAARRATPRRAGQRAGTYSIAVAGLDSTNYEIAFVPGTLTVTISPSTTTLVASPIFNTVWRSGHADRERHLWRNRHGQLL